MPVETIAKISEALNKFIEHKNDTEANIGDTFKEAVNGKDILEEKGYILITNYKNLPEKLIRPDGTIVTYNYEFDENGDISSVALNSQEVTLEINSQRITISSSDGDGPTVIIEAEDGENLLNPPDNLVNYGMVDFRAIQAAFDELESVMNELEKKDSVKTKQALSDSSDADTHGDARVEQAINKCGETVFKIIKKADRSSVEYQRDGLDVFIKAVVLLPEKRR